MSKQRKTASPAKPGSRTNRARPLDLLRSLVEPGFQDPAELFSKALQLLVDHLRVDRALIVRVSELGYETLWWATLDGCELDPAACDRGWTFCTLVLEPAPHTLVLRNVDRELRPLPPRGPQAFRVRALIGVPLRRGDQIIGVLSVQHARPRRFSRADLTLATLVADVLASAMALEILKQELHMAREALELTVSVVEDSALETRGTGLPSQRYLGLWLKAYLGMAHRDCEPMALLVWQARLNRETRKALREVADLARSGDLLADLGQDTFLLLLPRTSRPGAELVATRLQADFNGAPVGVSMWDPAGERGGLTLDQAVHKARSTLAAFAKAEQEPGRP